MIKRQRLWSYALAGALAVSNLSAVAMPLTALAVEYSGNAEAGDKITFAVGNTGGNLKEVNPNPVTITDGEGGNLNAELPGQAAYIENAKNIPGGYHFAWNDGKKDLTPEATYADITVPRSTATLTGNYVGNILTIKDSNNATLATKSYEKALETAIEEPTEAHKVFKGWNLDSDPELEIKAGDSAAKQSAAIDLAYKDTNYDNETIVFTPAYEEQMYTIRFDKNGATTGKVPSAITGEYSAIHSTKLASPQEYGVVVSKKYYTLGEGYEWNTKADGTGETFAYTDDVDAVLAAIGEDREATLYYNWVADTKDVSLAVNNAAKTAHISIVKTGKPWDGSHTAELKVDGGTVTLPTVVATAMSTRNQIQFAGADDYEFKGWSTTATGEVEYNTGDVISINKAEPENINLFAVFEKTTVDEDSITLDPNYPAIFEDDEPEIIEMEGIEGAKVTVTNSFTAPKNYHFIGWNTTATGEGGIAKADGFEATYDGSTYYAQWEKDKFTVETYNGSTRIDSRTVDYDSAVQIGALPLVTGKRALGWDTNSSAVNPKYLDTTQVKNLFTAKNATVKLYAIYASEDDAITINYKLTKPGDNAATSTVSKNGTVTLNDSVVPGDNKALVGWTLGKAYASEAAAKASGATIYAAGSTYKPQTADISAGEITFYAVSKATVTVTFNGGGATATPMEDFIVDSGVATKLPKNTYKLAGKTFKGWKDGDEREYADEATITATTAVTLTAQWVNKESEYIIVYDKNCDSGIKIPSVSVEDKDIATTALAEPNMDDYPDGYTFKGWALSKTATKPDFVVANDKIADVVEKVGASDGDTITLYGVWELPEDVQAARDAANEAEAEAEAAKEAEAEAKAGEAAAKEDAATQKAAADKATQEAATQKAAADAANAELAKIGKAANNVNAVSGEKVDTKVDGTAVIKEVPATAIKNGKYEVPEKITVDGKEYTVTKIEDNTFKKNKSIKQITVKANITEIGKNAFNGASKLKKVTIKGKDVIIRKNAFKKINKKAKIFVADKDTKKNVEAKGGQPKSVKVKVKK
ncbi:InlB B-repeat-containing protein [Butyrivibrio sp. JL13D10]|uniref:InlB B-repeat-containing protein n=1 Tax=Butyrivibrio sp. JL13D10 TaxID=3236815 RepID=UPI0038B56331